MVVWSLTMVVVAVVVGLIVTGMPLTNPEICSLPLTAAACRPGCCMSLSIRAQYFISEEKVSTLYIAHSCNYRENPGYRYHVRSHGLMDHLYCFVPSCICLIPVLQFCLFCYNTTKTLKDNTWSVLSGATTSYQQLP